jgi:transcriptional regulator with XRE-family HTH domain
MLLLERHMLENPLGEFILQERLRQGISQTELARRSDVSISYLAQIEQGCNPKTGRPISPTMDKVEKLAKGLKVSPDALAAILRGTPSPNEPTKQSPGVLSLIQGGKHVRPLTDREEATLREAVALDMEPHAPFTDPGFMNRDPEDEIREEAFMLLRQLIRNTKQSRGMR